VDEGSGSREIDTKRYAKIEKIPGGTIEESRVLAGVMFNKVLFFRTSSAFC
jgi:T-complex protein 1 subunit gamma